MPPASLQAPDVMASDPSHTSGVDSPSQLAILRIVCCVAWADGAVSSEERQLLEQLVSRYFSSEGDAASTEQAARQLSSWIQDDGVMEEALTALRGEEDRILTLKLAHMMARVNQRPEDDAAINSDEKRVYRRLVDALGLTENQVREAEWAAEQDLTSGRSVWAQLRTALAGLGAWPTSEMLETPGMQWL